MNAHEIEEDDCLSLEEAIEVCEEYARLNNGIVSEAIEILVHKIEE